MAWAFAGRDDERSRCLAAFATARCVVVAASPGLGRTRFAAEIAERARADELVDDDSPPGAATNSVVLTASAALSEVALGALAPLVPSVAASTPVANDVVLRSTQAIARRFRSEPTLIVIDDAHLLDPLSVEVIHAVLDRPDLSVTWLLTVDSDLPTPKRIADLWQSDIAHLMTLIPMTCDQVAVMAGIKTGSDNDSESGDATATRLHDATGGVPLLVHEFCDGFDSASAAVDALDALHRVADEHVAFRLQAAVDRVVGDLGPGELGLVEFLSFAGPVPADLLASIDSTLAALERRGVVVAIDGMVGIAVPLVSLVIGSSVSRRRRWALYSVMVARFDDAWSASGLSLFHLMMWDAQGTSVLSAQRSIDAARWALDDRRHDAARTLYAAAATKESDLIALDLDLLAIEIDAATGAESPFERYGALIGPAETPRDRSTSGPVDEPHDLGLVLDSILASVSRGDLSTTAAIGLLEAGRQFQHVGPSAAHLAVVLADLLWMTGTPAAAERVAAKASSSTRSDSLRRARRTVMTALALERGDPTTAIETAKVAKRVLTAAHSRDAEVLTIGDSFARLLTGAKPAPTRRRQMDSAAADTPALAAASVIAVLRGDISAACSLARALDTSTASEGFEASRLGVLRASLARLADDGGSGWSPIEMARPDGEWKRWAEALSASIVASNHSFGRAPARTIDAMRTLADEHLAAGAVATGFIVAHHLARLGAETDAVGSLAAAGSPWDGEVPVLTAIREHALASAERHGDRLVGTGRQFATTGWFASAADSFALAASCALEQSDPRGALVAVLAHELAAERCDDRCVALSKVGRSIITEREGLVAQLVASGASSAAAAEQLGRSTRTVDNQLYGLYSKFELGGRHDLADAFAAALELFSPTSR